LKHFPLHFHVNFHIDVSSIDICVPQPVSYHVDVVSSPQQMHGRCMSYRMGGNGFGSEGRALCSGGLRVLADDMADSEASNANSLGVKKQAVRIGVLWHALFQVGMDGLTRFRP